MQAPIEALCTAADDEHEPVRVAFAVRDDYLDGWRWARRRGITRVTVR